MFQQLINLNPINVRTIHQGNGLSGGPQWQHPRPWMQPGSLVGPTVAQPAMAFLPQQIPVHSPVSYPFHQVNAGLEPFSPYSIGTVGYPLMARHQHQWFPFPFNTNM